MSTESDRYQRRRALMAEQGQTGGIGRVFGSAEGEISVEVTAEELAEAIQMLDQMFDCNRSYRIWAECSNCGNQREYEIAKGTRVREVDCLDCECACLHPMMLVQVGSGRNLHYSDASRNERG